MAVTEAATWDPGSSSIWTKSGRKSVSRRRMTPVRQADGAPNSARPMVGTGTMRTPASSVKGVRTGELLPGGIHRAGTAAATATP